MDISEDRPTVVHMEIHDCLLIGDILGQAYKIANSFIYSPPKGQTTNTEHCAIPTGAIQKRSLVTVKRYTPFDVEILTSDWRRGLITLKILKCFLSCFKMKEQELKVLAMDIL